MCLKCIGFINLLMGEEKNIFLFPRFYGNDA